MDAIRALQHPGYYYYMKARCTKASREGFLVHRRGRMWRLDIPTKKKDYLMIVLEVGTYTRNHPSSSKSVVTSRSDWRCGLRVSSRRRVIHVSDSVRTLGISLRGVAWVKLTGHRFFERITEMYR
ncbi:hypothetical protein HD554DRAFT_875839 [Boletus coccyginus]|nr:hypothetical protein HD554DRAFT_875839 [Boletus coccyginus]